MTSPALPAGIWAFPLTPFDERRRVHPDALAQHADRLVASEPAAIVALGQIAEAAVLSGSEWQRCVDVLDETVAGRVPLIVAVPADRDEALARARSVGATRARALMVEIPPTGLEPRQVEQHLVALAAAADRPLVVYDGPPALMDQGVLERLVARGVVAGVKDRSGDMRRVRRWREHFGEALVLAGAWEDMTLPYWSLGVQALCPASVAHDPAYVRAWSGRLAKGDIAGARHLLEAFAYPMSDLRRRQPGISVAAVKAAMRVRGFDAGPVREPGSEIGPAEHATIVRLLQSLEEALSAAADLVREAS